MIYVQNLGVQFAGNTLFEGISFRINRGEKVGLAGKNGAGKSTLLKILSQKQKPTEGKISLEGDVKIGYLTQDLEFTNDGTVWEETEKAYSQLVELQKEIDSLNLQLTQRTDYESDEYMEIIEKVTHATEQFSILGGYGKDADMEKVLLGLGFKSSDFHRPTSSFSGGWRMRLELAKLLLQKNDALLLDEPTNHLDIDSILWLEDFLKDFTGAVILVSHDKLFLDNLTQRTIEISNKKIQDYKANYSKYLLLREERRAQLGQAKKNQEQYIKHTEKLIDKFRAKASKASTAQSLMKKLDRIDIIEMENEDVHKMNIQFQISQRSGKVVLKVEDVAKSYGEKEIFSNAQFLLERGEKVAFVGQNGQGKTTLARCIVGEIPFDGSIELGHNVELGYFAQEQTKTLNENATILEEAENAATEETRKHVRDYLGAFLFSGDTVDKRIKVLSGGERNRLAMCKLLLHPSNFLILDEPTNHLDIQSKEILKNALIKYEGTLIIVSHDREFLDGLTEKTIEFKEGRVKEILGNISDYLDYRKAQNFREIEKVEKEKIQTPKKDKVSHPAKDLKQLENKLSKVEENITKLENEILKQEKSFLNQNPSEKELADYQSLKSDLDQQMSQWEKIIQEINA